MHNLPQQKRRRACTQCQSLSSNLGLNHPRLNWARLHTIEGYRASELVLNAARLMTRTIDAAGAIAIQSIPRHPREPLSPLVLTICRCTASIPYLCECDLVGPPGLEPGTNGL